MATKFPMPAPLPRTVGLPGAVLLGLGSMLGTGAYVGVALAADVAGPLVVPATLLAAGLALCNALSSAQLAAAHPVSGGTYEYGHRLLGPRAGFAAGWLFLGAKGASAAAAAVGLTGYLLALTPHVDGPPPPWLPNALAAGMVLATTAFVAGGLRRSNAGNAVSVALAAGGLFLFLWWNGSVIGAGFPSPDDLELGGNATGRVAAAAALMFVAFAGYGRLATLGEEVRDPAVNIPRAVMICVAATTMLYLLLAAAVVGSGPGGVSCPRSLPDAGAGPLASLAARSAPSPLVPAFVTAGACAALGGTLLNLLLGLSRVLLAMARRGEMPGPLAAVANDSPRRAVWAAGAGVAAVAACGSVRLAWSASACAVLLYYGLTNAAALRLPGESRRFHRGFAWAGLAGCGSLAWFVTPAAALTVAGWLLAGAAWRAAAVRARRARAEPGDVVRAAGPPDDAPR